MQNVKMQTLEFRGNHYDYGVAQAEWLKSTKMLQNREKEWRIRRPRFDINIDETKNTNEVKEDSEKIDDIQNSTEVTDEVLGISEIDECEEITKS